MELYDSFAAQCGSGQEDTHEEEETHEEAIAKEESQAKGSRLTASKLRTKAVITATMEAEGQDGDWDRVCERYAATASNYLKKLVRQEKAAREEKKAPDESSACDEGGKGGPSAATSMRSSIARRLRQDSQEGTDMRVFERPCDSLKQIGIASWTHAAELMMRLLVRDIRRDVECNKRESVEQKISEKKYHWQIYEQISAIMFGDQRAVLQALHGYIYKNLRRFIDLTEQLHEDDFNDPRFAREETKKLQKEIAHLKEILGDNRKLAEELHRSEEENDTFKRLLTRALR